jgi:hypothetical protein
VRPQVRPGPRKTAHATGRRERTRHVSSNS